MKFEVIGRNHFHNGRELQLGEVIDLEAATAHVDKLKPVDEPIAETEPDADADADTDADADEDEAE